MKRFAKKIWIFICAFTLLCEHSICMAAAKPHPLSNPDRKLQTVYEYSSYEDGYRDTVTWDCVWFGSFPQTWVKESSAVYKKLKKCTSWDKNNDTVIGGQKYRRYTGYQGNIYFYKYEPIKWRVLKVAGNQATLISDVVLEYRPYSDTKTLKKNDSWKISTIRSYLNGYSSKANAYKKSYNNSSSFIVQAFTKQQRGAILKTTTCNNDMAYQMNTGKATSDKIFLPAEADVCQTSYATGFGFPCDYFQDDESRIARMSDYCAALESNGMAYQADKYDTGTWSLRTNSSQPERVSNVWWDGVVAMADYTDGYNDAFTLKKNSSGGIRPMMNVDLSLAKNCYYAGTVKTYPDSVTKVTYSKKIRVTGNQDANNAKPKSGITKNYTEFDAKGKLYEIDGITYKGYINAEYYEWFEKEPSKDVNTMYMLRVVKLPNRETVDIPTYVMIGNTKCVVTAINAKAAYKNDLMQTLTMGDSIFWLGKSAFAGCTSLKTIQVNGEKRLPAYIRYIEKDTFLNCKSLEELALPEDANMHQDAFKGCEKLVLKNK